MKRKTTKPMPEAHEPVVALPSAFVPLPLLYRPTDELGVEEFRLVYRFIQASARALAAKTVLARAELNLAECAEAMATFEAAQATAILAHRITPAPVEPASKEEVAAE